MTFVTEGGLGRGFRSRREKRKLSSVLFFVRRRRVLVGRLTRCYGFQKRHNLILPTMALSMIMNLLFCTTSMYQKNRLSVRFLRTFWSGRARWVGEFCWVSLWKTRYTNSEGSFANPWYDYLQSALCVWWTRRFLDAAKAAFIPMQIWWHDP